MNLPKPHIKGLLTPSLGFSQFFDEIPVGIAVMDREFRIVYLNRSMEALTGFSMAEAYGVPCRNILRSSAFIHNCPAESRKVTDPISMESDIINRDRVLLPVRLTIAPLFDTLGKVSGYIETLEDLRSIKELVSKKNEAYSFSNIIGRSPGMEKIFQTLPVLAQSDASILITGETGTGKDLVAEAIHKTSGRSGGAFIKVNCGALPETLLESELFGHVKGAFTGAVENKPGRFRMAHNGTLFLTEIGDLPLSLQVKLLTFLDDKVIYPLGGTKPFNANVRVVAATHRNLEGMVREGSFRQDLLFRLNVARIHLPPLRQREGDIRLLLDHFLNVFRSLLGKNITGYSENAMAMLLGYAYPGNIRELRNMVEYAANIATGATIRLEHLPAYLLESGRTPFGESEPDVPPSPYEPAPSPYEPAPAPREIPRTWAAAEREMIMEALIKSRGRKSRAAELLGWGRSTLWRKMKQYEIES